MKNAYSVRTVHHHTMHCGRQNSKVFPKVPAPAAQALDSNVPSGMCRARGHARLSLLRYFVWPLHMTGGTVRM